jgi:hypothetical protein
VVYEVIDPTGFVFPDTQYENSEAEVSFSIKLAATATLNTDLVAVEGLHWEVSAK